MPNLLIVDDHPMMRKGLVMTLDDEMDLHVVAQVESAEDALDALEGLDVDLVVTDVSLPGMSGLELVKHLQATRPALPVLVVSRHDESLYAERALRTGARGYVMKLEPPEVIVKAIRRVLRGGVHVSEEVSDRLLAGAALGHNTAQSSPMELLSDRELEVFERIGKGQGTRQIAEALHLSVKTVESYRARIKNKLALDTATELVQHAVQWVSAEGGF